MKSCMICGEKCSGVIPSPGFGDLCPECGKLLDWFRSHYADVKGLDLTKITTETRFIDLSVDSLDYVEWVIEAEERFGVVIPDQDAERLMTVGDYLGYIRLSMGGAKPSGGWSPRSSGGSDPMWDRQLDA
jgi:acyl carrier protein